MAIVTRPWTATPPPELRGGAVTIGNFDGVHRGHQLLVESVRRWADRLGGPAVAVTFDPPPVSILNPSAVRPMLSTFDDRMERLVAAGVDHVLVLQTDAGLLSLSPEAFFEEVLVRQLRVRAVVEGSNFRFGRGRSGDTEILKQLCASSGVAFEEVSQVLVEGEPVSSSRVREALLVGDVQLAARLLGRPYHIAGVVGTGAKRGHQLGFPTANLDGVATLAPAVGVYAVRAIVDGVSRPAAANVGPNPTFGEDFRKIEVHVIDFAGDLYGKTLTVEFVVRLRETRRFSSIPELIEQLDRDVSAAREVLMSPL